MQRLVGRTSESANGYDEEGTGREDNEATDDDAPQAKRQKSNIFVKRKR